MESVLVVVMGASLGLAGPCLAQDGARGIDVAKYQGDIDWAKVKASGISFGIARVSDGLKYPDGKFKQNWANMKTAGVIRGVYQYFRPGQDAVAQADLLLSAVGQFEKGDLPPFLDVEAADGVSPGTLQSQVAAWISHVKSKTGITPIVYTAPGFWNDKVGGAAAPDGAALWVANWKVSSPKLPKGWSNWVFWQYTDSLKVPGISAEAADGDVFHGSEADLKAFAESHGANGAGTGAVSAPSMPAGTGTLPGSNAASEAAATPVAAAPSSPAASAGSPLANLLNSLNPAPAAAPGAPAAAPGAPAAAPGAPAATTTPAEDAPKSNKEFNVWIEKTMRKLFKALAGRSLPDEADTPEKAFGEFKKCEKGTEGAQAPKGAIVFYADHFAIANGDGTVVAATAGNPINPGTPIGSPLGWAGPAKLESSSEKED